MRIAVLIPSRGRTRQLSAALTSLRMCQSGENQVLYIVAVDDDDLPTKLLVQNASNDIPLAMRVGPRPKSLGSVANDLAEHWPADVYCVWADDLLCISYEWDKAVAKAAEETPHGVFWWKSQRDELSLVPIITEKWRAATGRIFTEHFPFWYDDCWLYELWIMATDTNIKMLDIRVVDKPTATTGMRDLSFWNHFYHAMRQTRVEEARAIAAKLGLPPPECGPTIKEFLDHHSERDEKVLASIMVTNKAETDAPSERYLEAKKKAEELLQLKAAA